MKRTIATLTTALACLTSIAHADVSPSTISPDTAATIDREWKSYIEPLLPLGAKAAPLMSNADDPQQRQELYQQLFKMISAAYLGMLSATRRTRISGRSSTRPTTRARPIPTTPTTSRRSTARVSTRSRACAAPCA